MKKFLQYVEIQTKITSFFAFFLTLGFMSFVKIEIKALPTLIFFLGMLCFDLTTTAINNYIDSKGNGRPTGYTDFQGKAIIFILLTISVVLGITLVLITDLVVLLCGALCFLVGIFYTWGPVPISRQPYGEIISGVMYGYFIPFIIVHANAPGYLVDFSFNQSFVNIGFDIFHIIKFLIAFFVPTVLTASIMLANNTCDLEADIEVNRYTLVFYIGKKWAVILMQLFYISLYCSVVIAVILKALPLLSLITLLTIPLVKRNFEAYRKDLVKQISFGFIIKNFIVIMSVLDIGVILGSIL